MYFFCSKAKFYFTAYITNMKMTILEKEFYLFHLKNLNQNLNKRNRKKKI